MSRVARLLVVLIPVAVLFVNMVRGAGDSPLTKAAKSGDLVAVRKLISVRQFAGASRNHGDVVLQKITSTPR